MNKKVEIGLRLKDFAKKNFGGVAGLERHLNKSAAYFQNYLNGRSYLGGETLAELAEVGCDVNYLLTGKQNTMLDEETKKKFTEMDDRFTKLEAKLFRLTEENEELKEENTRLREVSEKGITLHIPSKLDKQKVLKGKE